VPLRNLLTRAAFIIEDDGIDRTVLPEMISKERDWNIVEAADAEAALGMLRGALRPDLCFLDLQMPQMDGLSLLREIRANPELRNLRIAVSSALQDREKIRSLAELKVAGYLLKPLAMTKVHATLKAATG